MRILQILVFFLGSTNFSNAFAQNATARVASFFISQDFLNQQLAAHSKSELLKEIKISLDPDSGRILLKGKIQVPVEELRAINLDPSLGLFRFQVSIKPESTPQGFLVLEFPLAQTYLYPAQSLDPQNERIIIPVQMLSIALASARGYLAALSGDFSGFDRRTLKLKALVRALDRSLLLEKNKDVIQELGTQKASLKLQLAAVPIERQQLQSVAKQVEHLMGFTGEKELNLNEELGARKNALILKLKLSQLTPFLKGVELGAVKILKDKKDGAGEHYFAVDINSEVEAPQRAKSEQVAADRAGDKVAPALMIRLDESLFESRAVLEAEKKEMGSKLRNLKLSLKDDGLHVAGGWHVFFFTIPFDTIVDIVSTKLDVFEVRVRELDVAGIDLEFLTKFVLEAIKKRLDLTLKGICNFEFIGTLKDHSRALRVLVNPKALVPAFPNLHLREVDIRDREFILKIGEAAKDE